MGKKTKTGSLTRQQRAKAQQHRSKLAPSSAHPRPIGAPPVRVATPDGNWTVNVGEFDRLLDNAATLMEQGRVDEAGPLVAKALDAAPEESPMRAKAAWMLGTLYAMKKDWSNAYRLHSEAVRLDPTQPEYWFNLGLTCLNRNMVANAGIAWTRCMALGADAYMTRVVQESLPQLHRDARRHLAEQPHMTLATLAEHEVLYRQALDTLDRGDAATAHRMFLRCTELDPQHHRSWGNLGAALLALRQFEQADEAFAKALAIQPDYAFALQCRQDLPKLAAV